jgi:hypothetical protein
MSLLCPQSLLGLGWYFSLQHPEFVGSSSFVMLGGLTALFSAISIQTLFKLGTS